MKYVGVFKNIKDEQYTVNIITENDPSTIKEIKLGSTPFIVQGKSDGLYSTLKLREATITIVNGSYLFDLYSSTAHGTKVEVYNVNNTPVFIGYVTPNAYNQGYSSMLEEIEVQAVDGVSTLEYFNYETGNKTIVSFLSIIDKCLAKCNCYTTLIYPKSIQLTSTDTGELLSKLYISENNFFGDDEEATPLKMKEVLDEVMKYLGLTLTVHNNEIMLLDYDYITTGGSAYWKHTINGSTTTVSLTDNYTIVSGSHAGADASLSLSDTYNQISINVNLYEIKDLVPDLFEDENLYNITNPNNGYFGEYVEREPSNCAGSWKYLCRFYNNKKYNQMWYQPVTHVAMIEPMYGATDVAISGYIGCTIAKVAKYDSRENKPAKLSWDNWIQCGLGIDRHESSFPDNESLVNEMNVDLPILEINTQYQVDAAISGINDKTSYIVINGEFYQNDSTPYVNPDKRGDVFGDSGSGGWKILKAKLQVGNKYWNGAAWTTTDSSFTVQFGDVTKDSFQWNWVSVRNTVDYTMEIDAEGYTIPINKKDKLFGKIKFTILRPKAKYLHFLKEKAKYIIFKNLEVVLCSPSSSVDKSESSDVKYTNIINDAFVNEFSDIELKVNSQTEKGYSFSSVLEKDGSDFVYNTSLFYVPLNKSQLHEYNLIEKMYNHFKDTKKILSMTIGNAIKPYSTVKENNLNTVFVVDTQEIDYANDTSAVTLNEV